MQQSEAVTQTINKNCNELRIKTITWGKQNWKINERQLQPDFLLIGHKLCAGTLVSLAKTEQLKDTKSNGVELCP